MSKWSGIVAATVGALAIGTSYGHTVQYSATLSGAAEAPANASPGTGTALVTFDYDLVTMRVQASFSGLTGNVTASHIHGPTTIAGTGTAGVMTVTPTFTGFPSGVTSGTYDHTFDMTVAGSYNPAFVTAQGSLSNALNALTSALDNGKSYLNIHTSTFGGGEIRGFLTVVPEPASMTGLAMTGLILRRRRQV